MQKQEIGNISIRYICIMGSIPNFLDVKCEHYQAGECKHTKYCSLKAKVI